MKKFIYLLFLVFIFSNYALAEQTPNPVSNNGRYAIVFSPHIQRSTFLLDTKTGKTWSLLVDDKGEYSWIQCTYDWYKQNGELGGFSRNSVPSK
jgi:hypothetical protein